LVKIFLRRKVMKKLITLIFALAAVISTACVSTARESGLWDDTVHLEVWESSGVYETTNAQDIFLDLGSAVLTEEERTPIGEGSAISPMSFWDFPSLPPWERPDPDGGPYM
jgi:hypothetical protein